MTNLDQAPTIFESFNARALTPSQVARTFVPSDSFRLLTTRRHSLVVGPRGSGKTTLLKMLQPAALEAWSHPEADSYASAIDFTGVFVPFDRSWRAQLDALGLKGSDTGDTGVLGTAAFTTHIYRALVSAFLSRMRTNTTVREVRRISLSPPKQAELATMLYECWRLSPGAKSLLGVRAALGRRLLGIGSLGYKLAIGGDVNLRSADAEGLDLFSHFVDGITSGLDAWETVTQDLDEKWGMLFDELELAPLHIKRTLFSSLRSSDPRVLFKLALSPFDGEFPSGGRPEDPQAGQDYDPIYLWFSEKRQTLPFCRALWESMLEDRGLPLVSPKTAFGRSHFETTRAEWTDEETRTAYAPGTRLQREFSQLEALDTSFHDFLASRGYSSEHLDQLPASKRAADIRKIAPLVSTRLFFLREDLTNRGRSVKGRSRKRLTIYSGWDSVCAISEGNPRWFIGLVNQLLSKADPSRLRFTKADQAKAIEEAAGRYRAVLRTIPVASGLSRHKSSGLVAMLDSVGDYFRSEQIRAPFSAEPAGTFTIDDHVSNELLADVGRAVNAGSFVIVDENDEHRGFGILRKRRLRLCYLLTAFYGAMPRLSRAVALSRILQESKFAERDTIQLSLTSDG